MAFNHHTHEWGKNKKGSFCLHCGEFCEHGDLGEKGEYAMIMSMDKRPTLMWPTGEKITEEEVAHGDYFDSWSR